MFDILLVVVRKGMRPRGAAPLGCRHESFWCTITVRSFALLSADREVISCHLSVRCHTTKQYF